jgi:hypothetical protein
MVPNAPLIVFSVGFKNMLDSQFWLGRFSVLVWRLLEALHEFIILLEDRRCSYFGELGQLGF